MRKVKRWRYYCDHCKRVSGSAGHMVKHELGCTNNPHRICGLCRKVDAPDNLVIDLVAALGIGDDRGMQALRMLCQDCPACILAAIRQSKTLIPYQDDGNPAWVCFEFKRALASFWSEVNQVQAEREGRYEHYE